MKANLRRPCNDCPFRRKSAAGWLGSGAPAYFVSAALADHFGGPRVEGNVAEPCHMTVEYGEDEYGEGWEKTLGDAEVCVGALIFYRNVDPYKLPRDPQRQEFVKGVQPDHETVFSTAEEFVDHHQNALAKSWEIARARGDG